MSFENILDEIAMHWSPICVDVCAPMRAWLPLPGFGSVGLRNCSFSPKDEEDLAYFLSNIPPELPVTVIGLGSNLIIRDGGIKGVVIRLGRGFGDMSVPQEQHLRTGTIVPDIRLAMRAAEEGIAGLEFYRGIPGCVGGALRMNAGAHGGETKDFLIEARAIDRKGTLHVLKNKDMGYSYRHCSVPDDYIFTSALVCW